MTVICEFAGRMCSGSAFTLWRKVRLKTTRTVRGKRRHRTCGLVWAAVCPTRRGVSPRSAEDPRCEVDGNSGHLFSLVEAVRDTIGRVGAPEPERHPPQVAPTVVGCGRSRASRTARRTPANPRRVGREARGCGPHLRVASTQRRGEQATSQCLAGERPARRNALAGRTSGSRVTRCRPASGRPAR